MRSELDVGDAWLLDVMPSRRQTWSAIALAGSALAGFVLVLPFANIPLVRLNTIFPTLDAIVFVTDLVTAVLLFAQYAISYARPLLILAAAYLFAALIVIPHALTIAGAFSPNGLLGATVQTGSWLFIFWHLGFAIGLLAYALSREAEAPPVSPALTSAQSIIAAISVGLILLVSGLTWLSTVGSDLLPPIVLDSTHISSMVRYPISFTIVVLGVALVVLLLRRKRSELDLWLIVVALVSIGDLILSGLIASIRFSLGFYAARAFALLTSSIVLAVLLVETTRLYGLLVRSNVRLLQQQNSKLMNMEVMAASIAHEVRQPLTAITSFGEAAIKLLKHEPPNIDDASVTVSDMIEASQRADQTFKNIRTLFGRSEIEKTSLDLNRITLETLAALKIDLGKNAIETELELAPGLPSILGSKSQLQEVILNLVANAIEAMRAAEYRRGLKIATARRQDGSVMLEVIDTGPGLAHQSPETIFDPFVTTKQQGMGLGLALCRLIVLRHGGSITASHASPSGAAFRVVLPPGG